ncbi:MAG: hypothetical protein QG594_537 [Bacteroidota bacterium]|jgi:hypothetical protein|nr:hypothetical protein [Bacteroidota bacterium]
MYLSEAKQLILQNEIRTPILDDEKFSNTDSVSEAEVTTAIKKARLRNNNGRDILFSAINAISKNIDFRKLGPLPL